MPNRPWFYFEAIMVTVLSLAAANLWIQGISKTIEHFFPNSLVMEYLCALLITIAAVLILIIIFSDSSERKYKTDVTNFIHNEES